MELKYNLKRNGKITNLILKILKNLPASTFRDHKFLYLSCQLVPHPIQGGTHINLGRRLTDHVARSNGKVEILNQKKKIGGEFDSLSNSLG